MSNVTEAMRVVERRDFLPRDQRASAGGDYPLPIGHGQTNSQPSTVQAMLELLDVGAGMRALDVGAGSGWTTALLAHLVGPQGSAIGIELEPDIARWGADNLARFGAAWASLHESVPGVLGWPDGAPYDRVLVSAGANRMPRELLDQVAPDGVMVLVVASVLQRVQCRGDRPPELTEHGPYRFVPLR